MGMKVAHFPESSLCGMLGGKEHRDKGIWMGEQNEPGRKIVFAEAGGWKYGYF